MRHIAKALLCVAVYFGILLAIIYAWARAVIALPQPYRPRTVYVIVALMTVWTMAFLFTVLHLHGGCREFWCGQKRPESAEPAVPVGPAGS